MKKEFNPWPVGLAATLIIFCIVQFTLVTLASSGFEGLDDVEYYRHGVEYGKEIDRQERQMDLDWTIAHNFEQATEPTPEFPLRVALLNHDRKPIMHAKVNVKIGRTATIREDRSYTLKEVGPGIYEAPVAVGPGNWKLNMEVEKGEDLVKVEFRHGLPPAAYTAAPAESPDQLSKAQSNG